MNRHERGMGELGGRPLWDNGIVALLLVGLLGAEWIMRRRYDLP